MKARWIVASLVLVTLVAVQGIRAADKESSDKKFAATCPVSGKPAIESSFVEMKDGSKVYFCCEKCPKEYKADPKKFAVKANRQLLETGQIAQVACPVSGEPISKDHKVQVGQAE